MNIFAEGGMFSKARRKEDAPNQELQPATSEDLITIAANNEAVEKAIRNRLKSLRNVEIGDRDVPAEDSTAMRESDEIVDKELKEKGYTLTSENRVELYRTAIAELDTDDVAA